MKDVGEFEACNAEFARRFSRERILQSVVRRTDPVILDVGAHHGQSALFLRALFPLSIIHSFEPDPESYARLCDLRLEHHRCVCAALSDHSGGAIFYRNGVSHTNSLNKVNLESADSIRLTQERQSGDTAYQDTLNHPVTVRCTTLDAYCAEEGLERIDFLKIDVQGAEAAVLSGGAHALSITEAVVLEASFYDYYERSTSILELEQRLKPAGLALFAILEVSQNPMNGRTVWAEFLYTRRRLPSSPRDGCTTAQDRP